MRLTNLSAALSLASLVASVPFSTKLHRKTALIIIDVQNDFITGSLNNSRAPAILPTIYRLLDEHDWPIIIASQDWHPIGHVSFASTHAGKIMGDSIPVPFIDTPSKTETQGLYTDHCVPETWGAAIESGIQTRLHNIEGYSAPVNYIKKAQDHSVDSYSAFADNQYHRFTTLDNELRVHGVEQVVITGLLTDVCVRGSAVDAVKLGYEVVVVEDGTDSISDEAKGGALRELREKWGVNVLPLKEWEKANPTMHSKRMNW